MVDGWQGRNALTARDPKGHIAAGHVVELMLLQYDPFSDDLGPLSRPKVQELVSHFASCRWLPLLRWCVSKLVELVERGVFHMAAGGALISLCL
jgi:hypothetical protein